MSWQFRLRLRLLWYRTDKELCAFVLFIGVVGGSLAYAAHAAFAHQDETRKRARQLHAQNLTCLATNVYFEARGEPLAGQYAVAEVTMNRKGSTPFPDTVCGVVYEKSAFSWTEFRALPEPGGEEWQRARKVAEAVYFGRHAPALEGARFFHATYVNPDWAKEKRRVARIGNHVFYK